MTCRALRLRKTTSDAPRSDLKTSGSRVKHYSVYVFLKDASPRQEKAMLVLTRRPAQTLKIGNSIIITILEIRGSQVRIGIEAPRDLEISREECTAQVKAAYQRRDEGA